MMKQSSTRIRSAVCSRVLLALLTAALLVQVPALRATGFLDQIDVTGNVPSPIAGHVIGKLVAIRWDSRTIPVRYSMNTSLDPIPNPLGMAFLTRAAAEGTLQASLDQWNDIPTSFIEMNIEAATAKTTLAGFDFINELTFRTANNFTAIASSPSVTLIRDVILSDGDLIDNDADSDVSSAIQTAADVDGDGDIELPAGLYKAGTILDNDVQFNTKAANGLRFTVDPAAVDTTIFSVDLTTVAVHEFGHSIGLSHAFTSQKGSEDGRGATMFPFLDTGDPQAELQQRILDTDDVLTAAFHYPEGTASSGPAALQTGDVAFASAYGLVVGSVRHGVFDEPVAGANVYARNKKTGEIVNTAYSGSTQVSVSPTGGLFLISPAFNILDGGFVMALPPGTYEIGVVPVDGRPVDAPRINLNAQIGFIFGQQNFQEEFFKGNKEGALEKRSSQAQSVSVNAGKVTSGIDIVTNEVVNISNYGNFNGAGFTGAPAGRLYAVRIPATQLAQARTTHGPLAIQSAVFQTLVVNASVPVAFAEAMITTGSVDAAGAIVSLDLGTPLVRAAPFAAADNDFAPLFAKNPHDLGTQVFDGIASGMITNLFLVLRVPNTPFPGVSAFPPLIGLDGGVTPNDVPIFGLSYVSDDGGATWTRSTTFNFQFGLVLSKAVP